MFTQQVIVNEEREALPRAIALEVSVYLNDKEKEGDPGKFLRSLESKLGEMISAPVSARIATPTANHLIVLDKLCGVTSKLARKLMLTAAMTLLEYYCADDGLVEVRFGPLTEKY